jgi:predicted metalloprotease with PDZ domain
MRTFLTSTLLSILSVSAFAQDKYAYSIDLLNIKNDQVAVSLKTPPLKQDVATFSFPMAIPGSYARKDFGRFVSDLKAFDKNGKQLKVTKQGKNQYVINNATSLAGITYKVDDTWDKKHPDFIFQPGGSNIEAGLNVVMNNHAFYGYFEGNDKLPFEISVTKPSAFYASTHLDVDHPSAEKDIIKAPNYVYLADNPVIYAKPDTTSFYVGKTKINVSVFSGGGKVKSAQVAQYLKPIANALGEFFNGLPVNSYQFLYYFENSKDALTDRDKGEGGYGALEHNYSSLYYLPEIAYENKLISMINDVSTHEFLHIQTPLNLHSYEIENFNFSDPKMSQHLWLYEGVTEYFAHLVQLQNGLTDEKKFFDEMHDKINQAAEYGDFSMTEMSKRVMEDAFQKKYSSVYNRGALIAFMLDVLIREKTAGAIDLKSVIKTLTQKYGPSKPFEDDKLFDELVAASHPEVKQFIDAYIIGAQPLPYQQYFAKAGYEYAAEKQTEVFYPGRASLMYDDVNKAFVFTKVEKNALDIKDGDAFKMIDGVAVTSANVDQVWEDYFLNNTTHQEMAITVNRNGAQTVLKGKVYNATSKAKNYIAPLTNTSAEQQQMLNALKKKS